MTTTRGRKDDDSKYRSLFGVRNTCIIQEYLGRFSSRNKYTVMYPGFAWLIRRVLALMIEFIGPLYSWLQQFTLSSSCDWTLYGKYSDFQLNWAELRCTLLYSFHQSQSQSHIATDGQSVSKSWCQAPSGAHDQIFITRWQLRSFFLWGALSDERTGLSFVYTAGLCQRSLSLFRVPWYSRPYFTVSDLRLPFPSPPMTRRDTVKVFDPASTQVTLSHSFHSALYNLYSFEADP
jgi:hypothetical protein